MMNVARIAERIMANGTGMRQYCLDDRKVIHAMIDLLLDDEAVFKVMGNDGGANITVQFHSDEHRGTVENLLLNLNCNGDCDD